MRLRAKNELVEVINLFKNPENSTFYIAKNRCVYTVGEGTDRGESLFENAKDQTFYIVKRRWVYTVGALTGQGVSDI